MLFKYVPTYILVPNLILASMNLLLIVNLTIRTTIVTKYL